MLAGCRRFASPALDFTALGHGAEELVTLAQTPHADFLVLEHRLENAQNRFGPQEVASIEDLDRLEDLLLAQAGVFEG